MTSHEHGEHDHEHDQDGGGSEPTVQFILQSMTRESVSEHRSTSSESALESIRLGDLCSEDDDWTGALGHYRRAQEQGHDSADLAVRIACALDAIGEEEEAFEAFAAAYAKRPDPQTALSAGDSAATAGRWDDAEEWLNRAIAHDPSAKYPWYRLSMLYRSSGRPRAAAGAAAKASDADPSDAGLSLHWGELALDSGDLEKAEQALKRSLEQSPTSHEAMTLLGITLWRAARPDEGIRNIRLAMELEPEPRLAPGILAVMLRELDHAADAEMEERKVDALSRYDKEQLARLKQKLLTRED